MENIFDSVHSMNLEEDKLEKRSATEGAIEDYIIDLIKKSRLNKNKRAFRFASEKVELHTLVKEMINSGFNRDLMIENSDRIAKRWFDKEKNTQERYNHLMNLPKGSLIQSCFQTANSFLFLIAKIEHETFIDEKEYNLQVGLPFEKRILKTCIIELVDTGTSYKEVDDGVPTFEVDNIYVTDSSNKIAAYWYQDFLELKYLNTNEINTKDAFRAIDREIKKIKKVSPPDYTLLRNNLIGYFQTKESFTIDNIIEHIFGEYQAQSQELDLDKYKNNIRVLPENNKFDSQFSIIKKEVKARRYFEVNDKIEIRLKAHIDRMRDVVFSEEKRGKKFLVIETENEEVYELFKYRNEN
ncbi:hypothetical protein [Paraliobacillus zengyii]|uniref:hypothetical protein n=1 Tax=Paraliobacillus zengyii TaxID=2213194 RepID=UPI000DD4ACCA|nr:hypothetical protein [Paraliobacillus zengyii]